MAVAPVTARVTPAMTRAGRNGVVGGMRVTPWAAPKARGRPSADGCRGTT